MSKIKKAVRLAMLQADIETQRELARRAEIHPTTLSLILSGRVVARPPERAKLAYALGRTPEEIFGERGCAA